MNSNHLEYFLANQNRQLWHYFERVPCDVIRIQDSGNSAPEFVVNHPQFGIQVLMNEYAELVPQVGDDCILLAQLLEKYWGKNAYKYEGLDWSKPRRIYSIDNGLAKGLGSPLIVAPLRCFAVLEVSELGQSEH